ncbi:MULTISPECIES: nuclear transport factor 2 family protein [unclassified Nocardioides]|uniref:nuclear transport factor 2 family protein n=1 Tax=unclassified Nocardioides TaxID=2615069 RepID=UPI0030147EEA
MAASNERIREVVEAYVDRVGNGTSAEVVALYAEGATVEDPVGADVLTTREEIATFYGNLDGLEQETSLVEARIGGGQAAFLFRISTKVGDQTFTMAPIDVMTFDDDGLITSMKAYWNADTDMTVT